MVRLNRTPFYGSFGAVHTGFLARFFDIFKNNDVIAVRAGFNTLYNKSKEYFLVVLDLDPFW